MTRAWAIAAALILIGATHIDSAQSQGATLVLNHVAIVDAVKSVTRADMAIVIQGSRIIAVDRASNVKVARGAATIDLTGKYAVAGLVDMHNHLGSGEILPGPPGTTRERLRTSRQYLELMLASGFTSTFSTAHPDLAENAELRRAGADDAAPISRFFGVGRGATVAGGHASQPRFGGYLPTTPEEARANVRELKSAGVDGVKLTYSDQSHTGRPPLPVMRADIMQAMIDEAHAQGLKALVHAPTLEHAKAALRAGADALVHSVSDAPIDDEFIALMRKNRATYTTTLSLYTSFSDVQAWMRRLQDVDVHRIVQTDVYDRYRSSDGAKTYHAFFGSFPPANLEHAKRNVRRVFDAGIPVLAGTDTGVTGVLLGVSSLMELSLLVEAGLTPAEALRTATINAATALGRQQDLGTIEPGKLADLIILDADPLADIQNIRKIHKVIKGGVTHDPAALIAHVTGAVPAQTPRNDLPQPYQTTRDWGGLPPGMKWAAVTAVEPAPDGSIYVIHRCFANSCANRAEAPILKYNADGKLLASWGAKMFIFPHGATLDRDGNLWVTDARGEGSIGHQVFKFSPEGKVLMTLGKAGVSGSTADLFDQPTDVVIAPSGDIFVTDSHRNGKNNRIVRFTKDGKYVKEWGKKGSGRGEMSEPHTIAMDSRGRLFVGDRENNRIVIFDQDGRVLDEWRQFGRPSGIFITNDDTIYVADSESGPDTGAHELTGIKKGIRIGSARDGKVTAFIEDMESTTPDHSGAEGVGVDARGNVYGAVVRRQMLERHVRK